MFIRIAGAAALMLAVSIVAGPPAAGQSSRPERAPVQQERGERSREVPPDTQIVAAIWCDTPEQLETVLRAHYDKKIPLDTAIAAINRGNPEACIPARAIVKDGAEVRRFNSDVAIFAVHAATVHGVMRGPYALIMRPQTWYHAKVIAELTPL
jgi:hypothetical protein